MINEKNIIGFFNIEKCDNIKNMVLNENIVDISNGKQKTFVLINDKEILKGYISNISSITLAKR